jgi:hypothetical protein
VPTTTRRQALFSHEASHPFARDGDALIAQFSMNTWTPIHLSTGVIDGVNVLCELLILSLMLTQRAFFQA